MVILYICDIYFFNVYIVFVIYLCLFVSYCILNNIKYIYLYKGIVGGGYYDKLGNGVNIFCFFYNLDLVLLDFLIYF